MVDGPRLSGTWPQRTAVCPPGWAWTAAWTKDRLQAILGGLRRCPMRVSPSSSAWPDTACAYGVSPAPTLAPLSCRPAVLAMPQDRDLRHTVRATPQPRYPTPTPAGCPRDTSRVGSTLRTPRRP